MNKIIHQHVFNPMDSIFKMPKNTKAECFRITCSFEGECPLLKDNKCICRIHKLFGETICIFGKQTRFSGYTPNAKKFYIWIDEQNKFAVDNNIKQLGAPEEKMAIIGNYIWLPYSFLTMCKDIPLCKDIPGGASFIHIADFNLETILKIINARPQSLFGGEIKDYQKKTVPLFLIHLKHDFPDLFKELLKNKPELEIPVNYVGRKAKLWTLKAPFHIRPYDNSYPVAWYWDGEKLTTDSLHSYNSIWGNIKAESIRIEMIPKKDSVVVIRDNSWVTDKTEIVE